MRLESADIRLDGPTIVEVAESVKPRPGDKIIDMSGRTIYAGFIDSMAEIDVDEPAGAPTGTTTATSCPTAPPQRPWMNSATPKH